ncbi:MAG: hypothetical protein H8D46_01640, partial [FCB group bacterium]|nr:hypothetical protein [FCB group bacterium]
MIRLTGILVLAYGLLLQIVFAAEYNMDAFNLGLESFTEDSSIVAYCREFVENAEDIDVIREAQNKWNRIDKDNALEYFAALAEVNPESPKYLYLKGRIVPSKLEQVELGRKVISLDEDWSYGYRLLLAGYVTGLFDKRGNSVEKQTLAEELEKDEHQFSKLIEIDGEEDYSLRFMRSYHFYKENYTAVIDVLDKAAVLNADWVNPYEYARVYFEMGNYDKT